MIGRPKHKMLWCGACEAERSCKATGSWEYECRKCGKGINVIAASNAAHKKRQAARASKTGSRESDREYMAYVIMQPCCRCGAGWPNHAHHSVHRSQGGSDRTCVPLCNECHTSYHSQLGSIPAALAAWGVDLRTVARELNAEFDSRKDEPV